MRVFQPVSGHVYHVYNRGVEKRKVFLDDDDCFRFIHDLFEFNDMAPAINLAYHIRRPGQSKAIGLPKIEREPRKLLVELLAFCLMPNHFHLMVRQKMENGVSLFMQKVGTGYAQYFNKKYERVGPLFQGKYKIEIVKNDAHLLHLPYYIHANPLYLTMPEWSERELKNHKQALQFLESYRWSSFPDYTGQHNFPSVTQREFLLQIAGDAEHYRRSFAQWLKAMDIEDIRHLTLES